MTRFVLAGLFIFLTAGPAVSAGAEEIGKAMMREIPAPASRMVNVDRADLQSTDGRAAIAKQVRLAARAACKEEHPRDFYLAQRACATGAARDALAELDRLANGQRAAGILAWQQLAIAVSAR
jgi:UrcA family protein